MRLLIFTQKIDSRDPILGFFCGWVTALARRVDHIYVICLEKGTYNVPQNVNIYSLGKEHTPSRLSYLRYMWKYVRALSLQYDAVFVHMNQEYVLLGGLYWKLTGIPIYFWRNHPYGNFLTKVAVYLSHTVFCTSNQSYTAQFKKTKIMPVGVDTHIFKINSDISKKKNSMCIVGRISRIKRVENALSAVKELIEDGIQVSLSIIGPRSSEDILYFNMLENYVTENHLGSYVKFYDAVLQDALSEIYSSHEICLNLTQDGSFDKTIIESASSGAIPLVSNKSLQGILPDVCITDNDPVSIAQSIRQILNTPMQIKIKKELQEFATSQSLDNLVDRLIQEINV